MEESTTGLFAIISPETDDVTAFVWFDEDSSLLARTSRGSWMQPIIYGDADDPFLGELVPVEDDFIDVYDKALADGTVLTRKDAEEYLRDTEF